MRKFHSIDRVKKPRLSPHQTMGQSESKSTGKSAAAGMDWCCSADTTTTSPTNNKSGGGGGGGNGDDVGNDGGSDEIDEIDEQLYSRQLYVMGREGQRKMMSSRVVLVGMSGLGAEVAKNVILAGVSSVTLVDPHPPDSFDLGGNFYLSEDDLGRKGKGRAELCRDKLAELNRYVDVTVADAAKKAEGAAAELTEEGEREHILSLIEDGVTCVVVTIPYPTSTLVAIDDRCREVGASFVCSAVAGVFGYVFCDFGSNFVVTDVDGELPATSQIDYVLPTNPAFVRVLDGEQGRHGLGSGDHVTFNRVEGDDDDDSSSGVTWSNLLNGKEFEVRVKGPHSFELVGCDGSVASSSASRGYITQVKTPQTVSSFRPLREVLDDPGNDLMMSDFAKADRPRLLHLAFRALAAYSGKHGNSLPRPGDADAAGEVWEISRSLDKEKKKKKGDRVITRENEVECERIVVGLASTSRAVLSPMCAAVGGVVGQEVLKACSSRFTPITGFLYLDAEECLPRWNLTLPRGEVEPTGTSRYDSQVACFGRSAQDRMGNATYFLVGAGAIGCEMLKNLALMGVGCGGGTGEGGGAGNGGGAVHVTDMDTIERSNLSRQFLFRDGDIGKFKSSTAAAAVQTMNPDVNVVSHTDRVAPETEHVFDDDFYGGLDGICTALDNVEARLYIDGRCLLYGLPMLESGTLGTKGNTQVVVPHLTENYGATRDPPEKGIPVCTLHNFPNRIQHTLQWARDYFAGTFQQGAEDVNGYLMSSGGGDSSAEDYVSNLLSSQPATALDTLESIRANLDTDRPAAFRDCVRWARLKFEELFHDQIEQLLYNFPPDQVTSTGTKFWSGSKRCPRPLSFDVDSTCGDAGLRNHVNFVVSAANLRAAMYGIKGRTDEEYFRTELSKIDVPKFTPKDGVKITTDEDGEDAKDQQLRHNGTGDAAADDDADDEDADRKRIQREMPKPGTLKKGFRLNPIEFDKDVDEHMRFVTACSNLRAMNYGIPTEDVHQSRAIAGRIIPAIATTTALVAGLVCIEMYKVLGTSRRELGIDAYKNGYVNLAIPFMTLSEPTAPARTRAMLRGEEWHWTAWDSIDLHLGDSPTLQEFLDAMKREYNLDIYTVASGRFMLYSSFGDKKKAAERMGMTMTEIVKMVSKKDDDESNIKTFMILEVGAMDVESGEDVDLPHVKFRLKSMPN